MLILSGVILRFSTTFASIQLLKLSETDYIFILTASRGISYVLENALLMFKFSISPFTSRYGLISLDNNLVLELLSKKA